VSDAAVEAWKIMGDLVLDNQRRRQVADALGMSFGRSRALRRIAARPMSMGELAALEGQGLVERQPHPTDRRAKVVVATRKGKAAARRAESILGTPPAGLAGLTEEEQDELVRLLRKIVSP
jgi:DNA-binding MarR family transcriptional regulator